jgi:hypothetical protein
MSIRIAAEISDYVDSKCTDIDVSFDQILEEIPSNSGAIGEAMYEALFGENRNEDRLLGMPEFFYLPLLCLAYARDALEADRTGRAVDAWVLAAEAAYWLGMSKGGHVHDNVRKILHSDLARTRAIKRHAGPGGSHEKRAEIQAKWASGKYSSRDVCAEQECAALNMSISTARKALRGTPDPA